VPRLRQAPHWIATACGLAMTLGWAPSPIKPPALTPTLSQRERE